METAYFDGAMYVRLTGAEKLDKTPIHLGDGILKVGEYIQKMGEKKRTSFEMQGGWYLRYKGRYNDTLFFDTNTGQETSPYDWHYGFYYIDRNVLLISSGKASRDVQINRLEKFSSVQLHESEKQLSLFDASQAADEKCKTCICTECAEKHGTSPMTCEISDCIWCRDDLEETGYRTCSGYIDKGGRYEHG